MADAAGAAPLKTCRWCGIDESWGVHFPVRSAACRDCKLLWDQLYRSMQGKYTKEAYGWVRSSSLELHIFNDFRNWTRREAYGTVGNRAKDFCWVDYLPNMFLKDRQLGAPAGVSAEAGPAKGMGKGNPPEQPEDSAAGPSEGLPESTEAVSAEGVRVAKRLHENVASAASALASASDDVTPCHTKFAKF